MPVRTAALVVVLALGLAGVTAARAASQGAEPDRRLALRAAAEALSAARPPVARTDLAARGQGCVDDPRGDALPAPGPVDLVGLCLAYERDLRVTLRGTGSGWLDDGGGALVVIDLTGDDRSDLELFAGHAGGRLVAAVFSADDPGAPPCPATAAQEKTTLTLEVPARCVGEAERLSAVAFLGTPAPPTGDVAPEAGALAVRRAPPPPPADQRMLAAVAASRATHPGPVAEVFLLHAEGGPETLTAAALNGPVLLVPACGPLPDPVRDELRRLNPSRVTALGGPQSVCDDLLAAAARA